MAESSETEWNAYLQLVAKEPKLFVNPPNVSDPLVWPEIVFDHAAASDIESLDRRTQGERWSKIGVHYRDPYIVCVKDAVRFPDGILGGYSRVLVSPDRSDGVAVLPYQDGKFYLLRHFRHATRQFHIEAPRGFGEPGVSPADNARRELMEELGLTIIKLEVLGLMYADSGLTNARLTLFLAKTTGEIRPSRNEGVAAVHALAFEDLRAAVAQGTITDSFTLAIFAHLCAKPELLIDL